MRIRFAVTFGRQSERHDDWLWRARTELALLVLVSVVAPSIAAAQQVPVLKAGDRIRVTSQYVPRGEVEGNLINLYSDTLSMVASDSIGFLAIPVDSIGRFEVHRGKARAPTLIAAAIGAGLGALVGSQVPAPSDRCDAGFGDIEDCDTEVSDVVIGTLAGAVGLGLIARTLTKERWERVSPDLLFDVIVQPVAVTQVTVSVSLRF